MRLRSVLRVFSAVVGLALMLVLAPTTPVTAAAIGLSQPSGTAGTQLFVAGMGFNPNHLIDITAVGLGLSTTAMSDNNGNFSVVSLGIVPSVPHDIYPITASDGSETQSTFFTVMPSISINNNEGLVGDQIYISGEGFSRSSKVYVYWDDETISMATAQSNILGSIDSIYVTIPSSTRGIHTITVQDIHGAATDAVLFSVNSTLTISPVSGNSGDTFYIIGTGFIAQASITVKLDGSDITTSPISITSDEKGGFDASFIAPSLPRGNHSFTALDKQGSTMVEFTIGSRISADPASSIVGDTITINGDGFLSNQPITLTIDDTILTTSPAQINSNSNGNFTAIFVVPSVTGGKHTIKANGQGGDISTTELNVISKIVATPANGPVGSQVAISGNGFAPNSVVSVYWDTITLVNSTSTNSSGSFSNLIITAPASTNGLHILRVVDAAGNESSINFNVAAKISVDKDIGIYADVITVHGSGFAGNSLITLYLCSGAEIYEITATTPNTLFTGIAAGDFTVTFSMPAVTGGNWILQAQDASQNTAHAAITIKPCMVINPTTGTSETEVKITGTGFSAGKTIIIKSNELVVNTNPSSLVSDTSGNFMAIFNLPPSVAGALLITASDGTNSASVLFIALPQASISPQTNSSNPGYVGMNVIINGTGFKASMPITATFDGTQLNLATDSDDNGSFKLMLYIPACKAGNHIIQVSDGTNTGDVYFVMESTVPVMPVLIAPVEQSTAKQPVSFDWEAVNDSSGVTYTLQVSLNADFSSLILEKSDIIGDSYTLTVEEQLDSTGGKTTIYWRVCAVDGAGNKGDWSPTQSFNIGSIWSSWVTYVSGLLVVGLIIVVTMLVLWIYRTRMKA